MQNTGFVQAPCSNCGTVVWIAQATGTGICPSCHTTNQLPAGGAPPPGPAPAAAPPGAYGAAPAPGAPPGGAPGAAPPGAYGAPAGAAPPQPGYAAPPPGAAGMPPAAGYAPVAIPTAGFPIGKLLGGVGAAVLFGALALGGWWVKGKFFGGGGKGKIGYGALGIDPDKADGDLMLASVRPYATKWKRDAAWWSLNFQAVRPDGTVDLGKGAKIEFISPKKVTSAAKSVRKDSIKKFTFGPNRVNHGKKWNATRQWKNVNPPPAPACTLKQLTAQLASQGLTAGKTVRITYDPQFAKGPEPAWHVIGEDPKINGYYLMTDCSEVKK